MQEDLAPESAYKIERCPYDVDSDKSDEDEDTPLPPWPALVGQLQRLTLFNVEIKKTHQ